MKPQRFAYAAPEVWGDKGVEHLQEAYGSLKLSLVFADVRQLESMREMLKQMLEQVEVAMIRRSN